MTLSLPPFPKLIRPLWLLATVLGLAAILFWASGLFRHLDQKGLHEQAGHSTVWGMHACAVAILSGLATLAPSILNLLGRRRLFIALGLVVLGYLACGLAPKATRILFDEHLYMQIGQTIARTGEARGARYARADYGEFLMVNGWVNKQPNGLPYLLAQVYRVFGVSVDASHQLNRVMVGLGAAGLYLALSLLPWSLPIGAGLAGALLFIFTPLNLWWGHTVAVEPASAATVILVLFAAALYVRLRDKDSTQGNIAASLLLGGATAFAAYFRPESLLAFPLVVAVLWSNEDRFLRDLVAWAALALALTLVLPNLIQLWSVRGEDWGATDGRRFDFAFIGKNFQSNAGYFFTSQWFPLAGTFLAFLGFGRMLSRDLSATLVLLLWFAISWGTFVCFYAGGYHYGASSRYAVISVAPVAIFMGIGAASLFGRLRRWPLLGYGVALTLLINWVAAFSFVPTLSKEAATAQEDVRFIADSAKILPQASVVISRVPTAWLLEGVSSSEWVVIEPQVHNELSELATQYPGGVYLHFGYWDNCEPAMAAEFANLILETEAIEILRRKCQEHIFVILRLDTPAARQRFGGKPPLNPDRHIRFDALLKKLQAERQAPPLASPNAEPAITESTPVEDTAHPPDDQGEPKESPNTETSGEPPATEPAAETP